MIINPRVGTATYSQRELRDVQISLEAMRDEAMKTNRNIDASVVIELAEYLHLHLKPFKRNG